ncbi:MAG: ATP-binding cassette domain-containing protein, partial [Bryobacteraceae bacterium]|nr:ATP-binding cassette domain-containing protein [Bryobacteraceae bacterium]
MGSDNDISFKALGLTRRYQSGQSELVVFAGLNLDVYRGERLALIGESGAGKSTLLHLLGGLDRPSEGTIFFETREISGLSDAELSNYRNREIGFVWQTHYLLPEFTALENVMMPLLIRNISQPEAAVAATRMLEE